MLTKFIIIGAGPAGISAGYELGKAGFEVKIFENLIINKNISKNICKILSGCTSRRSHKGAGPHNRRWTDRKYPQNFARRARYKVSWCKLAD